MYPSDTHRVVSAAGRNEDTIKASKGVVSGWAITNTTGAVKYVKLYDQADDPDAGNVDAEYDLTITASGGTFTLGVSVNGEAVQTTSALAFDASSATVETALIALSNIAAGEVGVTGDGPHNILFANALAATPVAVTVNVGSLTGGTATLATVEGGQAADTPALTIAAEASKTTTAVVPEIGFDTGIGIGIVADDEDAGSTAVSAGDVIAQIFYR